MKEKDYWEYVEKKKLDINIDKTCEKCQYLAFKFNPELGRVVGCKLRKCTRGKK